MSQKSLVALIGLKQNSNAALFAETLAPPEFGRQFPSVYRPEQGTDNSPENL